MNVVKTFAEMANQSFKGIGAGNSITALGLQRPFHRGRDLLRPRVDPRRLFVVGLAQLSKQSKKPHRRAPIAVARRNIGSRIEGLSIGRQPHGHRPAAPSPKGLHRTHINRVDIGTLFAIDLDGDVVFVDEPRDLFVVERFLLHHMAPMASRITHAEQHRPPQPTSLLESLIPPGTPVHGIMRVLQKVRADFEEQAVDVFRRAVGVEVPRARLIPGRTLLPSAIETLDERGSESLGTWKNRHNRIARRCLARRRRGNRRAAGKQQRRQRGRCGPERYGTRDGHATP